jgi:alkylation response protein AidB-like acyl-CoA dehydrogenase
MDFGLTKEQEMFRKFVRNFAEREVTPYIQKIEEDDCVPDELVKKMGAMKLFGIPFDKKYGGAGLGWIEVTIALEELGRVTGGVAGFSSVSGLPSLVLSRFGTEEQKEQYLTRLCSGAGVGSLAFTEAATGTDPKAIISIAKLEGDEYVINGSKRFISAANLDGPIVFFAKDSETPNGSRVSAFITEKNIQGYKTSKPWVKAGGHGTPVCDIFFDNMRIPAKNLIGNHGEGFQILQNFTMSNQVRICSAILGQIQCALDESVKYAKERTARGGPIAQFQTVQVLLADIAAGVEASRNFVYKVAWLLDKDDLKQAGVLAPLMRVFVTEKANEIVRKAIRVHGAYGIMEDFKVASIARNMLGSEVIEVVNDIHRLTAIGRMLAG